MKKDGQELYIDPLFVGLTRQSTIAGIPYTAFVVEVLLIAIIFLAVANLFYLALIIPIHSVLYLISASNPKVFNAIFAWIKTNGRCRNTKHWGAASFSTKPLKKWKD